MQRPLLHQQLATQLHKREKSEINVLYRSSILHSDSFIITTTTSTISFSLQLSLSLSAAETQYLVQLCQRAMNYIQTKCVVKRKGKETGESETLCFTKSKDNNNNNMCDRHCGKRYPLLSFWELPEFMKDNEYILRYYRANWPFKQALFSLFRWHNETLNVWTYVSFLNLSFFLFLFFHFAWLTLFSCVFQAFNWVFTLSRIDPREFDEA